MVRRLDAYIFYMWKTKGGGSKNRDSHLRDMVFPAMWLAGCGCGCMCASGSRDMGLDDRLCCDRLLPRLLAPSEGCVGRVDGLAWCFWGTEFGAKGAPLAFGRGRVRVRPLGLEEGRRDGRLLQWGEDGKEECASEWKNGQIKGKKGREHRPSCGGILHGENNRRGLLAGWAAM